MLSSSLLSRLSHFQLDRAQSIFNANCVLNILRCSFAVTTRSIHSGWPGATIQMGVPLETCTGRVEYQSARKGNIPQENQHVLSQTGYSIDSLRIENMETIRQLQVLGVNIVPRPSFHHQRYYHSLASLSTVIKDRELIRVYQCVKNANLLDEAGCLKKISGIYDSIRFILDDTNLNLNVSEKGILLGAHEGILERQADSVYKANHFFLSPLGKIGFTANYFGVPQRDIELANIIAELLDDGVIPWLLESEHEGVANCKLLPFFGTDSKGNRFVPAFGYSGSRSDMKCLHEINDVLRQFNEPEVKHLTLKSFNPASYHADVVFNFASQTIQEAVFDKEIRNLTWTEIFNKYEKNGLAVYAEYEPDQLSIKALKHTMKHVVPLKKDRDPLIANAIVISSGTELVLVVSDKLASSDEKTLVELGIRVIKRPNMTIGGGGSLMCMANVVTQQPLIDTDEWVSLLADKGKVLPQMLIDAVKDIRLNRR